MIGEVIGNFRLTKRLGRGGMGEVYLAEHKDLQTQVAVKVLNEEISHNTDLVQRFFNEARIVSKIKHAGTVKIFDSGFHNGQAYMIMELLDGESLAARLAKSPLPNDQVLDIGRQIASVLDATHRQGVIHRDLKPDNIFLIHDDEHPSGERVKVLDFGIAKLSGTLAIVSPKTSGVMGTPAYMAPEQWGDAGSVDWRVDAYSLGCVLFELLCGRPPFICVSIPQAYTSHAHTPPPVPSSITPSVSPELDAIVLRLLAKEPAERAVSMGQVTRELGELGGFQGRLPTPTPGTLQRVAIPTPTPTSPVAAPAVTATTIGGSAAELITPPSRSRPVLMIGIGGGVIAVVTIAIVLAVGGHGGSKPHAPATASEPARVDPPASAPAPVEKPAPPAPPPQQPPLDAPATAATETAKPATVTSASEASTPATVTQATVAKKPTTKPKPKPTTTNKPTTTTTKPAAGSDDDGGWGGRL